MTIELFLDAVDINDSSELNKVKLLIFYSKNFNQIQSLSLQEISKELVANGFAKPNTSRLKTNLTKSKDILKVGNNYSTSRKFDTNLLSKFPELSSHSEDIVADGVILPKNIFEGTRGYIEKLSNQINSSFQNNLFDGCAVLMRRLLEILLILTYRAENNEDVIKDENGGYKNLSYIINLTCSKYKFGLHKDSLTLLDRFRELGNFSAHRIEYNCRKADIEPVLLEYRATIETLMYKSKILK